MEIRDITRAMAARISEALPGTPIFLGPVTQGGQEPGIYLRLVGGAVDQRPGPGETRRYSLEAHYRLGFDQLDVQDMAIDAATKLDDQLNGILLDGVLVGLYDRHWEVCEDGMRYYARLRIGVLPRRQAEDHEKMGTADVSFLK